LKPYKLFILSFFILHTVWGQYEENYTIDLENGKLSGTLRLADSIRQTPVLLIIPGSGPTDRNGNNPKMQNYSLKMLADSLAAHHISSLRIDKRGIGQSKLNDFKESDVRFDDFVSDAIRWTRKLQKDPRFTNVVIAGHS